MIRISILDYLQCLFQRTVHCFCSIFFMKYGIVMTIIKKLVIVLFCLTGRNCDILIYDNASRKREGFIRKMRLVLLYDRSHL